MFIFMMVGLHRVVHHSRVVSTTTTTATHHKISNMAQHTSKTTGETSTAQPDCSLYPSKLDDSALGRFRTSLGSSGGVLISISCLMHEVTRPIHAAKAHLATRLVMAMILARQNRSSTSKTSTGKLSVSRLMAQSQALPRLSKTKKSVPQTPTPTYSNPLKIFLPQ
jgi:hypothetical protein